MVFFASLIPQSMFQVHIVLNRIYQTKLLYTQLSLSRHPFTPWALRSRVPDIDRRHVTTAGPTAMTAHASLLSSVNPFTPLNLISPTQSHLPLCLLPTRLSLGLVFYHHSLGTHFNHSATIQSEQLSSLQPSPSSFSPLRLKLCGTYLDPLSLFPLVSPSIIPDLLDKLDYYHLSPL